MEFFIWIFHDLSLTPKDLKTDTDRVTITNIIDSVDQPTFSKKGARNVRPQ